MKANKLFLLASFFLSSSLTPIAAQSKKEKKQQTEQAVREAVDAKTYKSQCGPGNAYERRQQTPDFRLFFRNKKRFGLFLSALFRSGV